MDFVSLLTWFKHFHPQERGCRGWKSKEVIGMRDHEAAKWHNYVSNL
jgi:hypothetical protein